MSKNITSFSPKNYDQREKERQDKILTWMCFGLFITNLFYCVLSPWLLASLTDHIGLTFSIALVGVITSLCGMKLVGIVNHIYLLRGLLIIVILMEISHILIAPKLYMYLSPFFVAPLFIVCCIKNLKNFWVAVGAMLFVEVSTTLYMFSQDNPSTLMIPELIYFNLIILIGTGVLFTFLYSANLQYTIQDLLKMRRLVRSEQLRIERASLAKSTFLTNLGQELRAPLSIITVDTLKLLNEIRVNPKINPYIETMGDEMSLDLNRIHEASTLLTKLIDDLSQISQLETEEVRLHITAHPLSEMINQISESIIDRGHSPLVEISSSVPDDHILYLDHQRTLKLFCLMISYVHNTSSQVQLSLDVSLDSSGALSLCVYEWKDSGAHNDSLQRPLLPLIETPTLSLPRAQPTLVLATRIADMLYAKLHLGNQRSSTQTRKTRFTLNLPQLSSRD